MVSLSLSMSLYLLIAVNNVVTVTERKGAGNEKKQRGNSELHLQTVEDFMDIIVK